MNYLEKCWTNENGAFIRRVFSKLEGDKYADDILNMVATKTPNPWSLLAYMAKRVMITRYMEIGVRRGYSMAMVAGRQKDCHIVGFDKWDANYGGVPNPGPVFVQKEMQIIGYRGQLEFINGDSALTVPDYATMIDEPFDLIFVDGDHTFEGAVRDVRNSIAMLDNGGHLIIDDLHVDELMKAWVTLIAEIESCDFYNAGRVGLISKR